MYRWLRRIGFGLAALVLLAALAGLGGFLWLRTSLPQTSGTLTVAGIAAPVKISRDDRGVPIVRAESATDAYYALGFLHAQDRLFQMDAMRRLGAGRLAEVIGSKVLETDRLMRTLGLYRSAEAQFAAASPALRGALAAYSAGVNAFLASHQGAWPPEFHLLGYEPEPWQPADSLVWGRLMALDLSGNWQAEITNKRLQENLPPYLFDLLVAAPGVRAAQNDTGGTNWRNPINEASNSWVVGSALSTSGATMIANDPHLGLSLPATWYLARLETPEMTWTGATAPGLPFILIGSNGNVDWTFTTTHSDTQDIFEERVVSDRPDHYESPDGPLPFDLRQEVFKIKGEDDVTLVLRATRHGPVVSDLDIDAEGTGSVLALAWTALMPDDRTPEALYALNQARDAAALEVALVDFHAPQQNIVFADRDGVSGFVAAGRVPVRAKIFENSRLPAPGWSGAHDWTGLLPFAELPQVRGGNTDHIVTANNDIRPPSYRPFLAADWPSDSRARQITALLEQNGPVDLKHFQTMQMDNHSAPLLAFVRKRLDLATRATPEIGSLLAHWDGSMRRDLAAPLIATIWLDRVARGLLSDEMTADFEDWWFWQIDRIDDVLEDGRACDDIATDEQESCDAVLIAALRQALADLTQAYGDAPENWQWGDSHRAHFGHPVFRNVPLLATWLDADLPSDGDFFTVNRGSAVPPRDGVSLPHVHGAGLRFVHDFGDPAGPLFTLAGGQSGNPFSPHYADWLTDWRDGQYRAITNGGAGELVLEPQQSAP
jgi:penicillin amidase